MVRWWIARAGLFLWVFAVVALSGPGRIDIVDGHIRYEVARSLVAHGDPVIRDPDAWFTVFPGRDGRRYSTYRFPQSAAGVVAILASDATGPLSEARRRFAFSLIGAVACGVLAVTYATVFRRLGQTPRASFAWAAAGIFCTPSWFYGTSTYDDILGTAAVVLAVVVALTSRHRHSLAGALAAGLALGLAFNCKQPLGIFVLPVVAAIRDPRLGRRGQWGRVAIIAALLAAGVAAYEAFDWYKFPPGSTPDQSELFKRYDPVWSGDPVFALVALTISLGTGVFFYNPPLLIALLGFKHWNDADRAFSLALAVAAMVFVVFIASLSFFKGDPTWGPRYLTPVFAVLWILAPAGALRLRRGMVVGLLMLGLLVQLGALSLDPLRLRVERASPSRPIVSALEVYFHPAYSHLLNRPREIIDVLATSGETARYRSPGPVVDLGITVAHLAEMGPAAVHKDHVLNSFRPWWASLGHLDLDSSNINVKFCLITLGLIALAGLILLVAGVHESDRRETSG